MRKALLILSLFFVLAIPASAVTITVTNCASSADTVGSLPWAIAQANTQTETVEVGFDIPSTEAAGFTTENGASFWKISLAAPLIITHNGVYIHGSSQEAMRGDHNLKGPDIEITKGTTTSLDTLIKIQQVNNCTIEGLVLNNSLGSGIWISYGNRNDVFRNYIGTNVSGEAAKANATDGVYIEGANNNRIGGLTTFETNIISGNARHGIHLYKSVGNYISGNRIGTGTNDATALGNAGYGIYMYDQSYSQTAEANIIANNGTAATYPYAVLIDGAQAKYNSLLRNRFFSNNGVAIRLLNDANEGVTPPTIATVEVYPASSRTYVSGASAPYAYIDIYQVETPEVEAAGEGKNLLGSTEADPAGAWTAYLPADYNGSRITATQTDINRNTSQFANNVSTVVCTNEYRPDAEIALLTNESDYIGANIINSSGFQQTKSKTLLAGQKATYLIRVKNTGTTAESMVIKGTASDTSFEVTYYNATTEGANVTTSVTGEGYVTAAVATNETTKFRMEVTAKVSQAMTKHIYLSAISSHDANRKDVVCATEVTTLPAQALTSFAFSHPATAEAGMPFLVTIEARDATGGVTTDVTGDTGLTVDYGEITPASIDATKFADDGIWSGQVTLSKTQLRKVTATNGTASGYFNITVYNATAEFSDAPLGVTVIVPPGAVTDEVTVTIAELSSLPGAPPSGKWQAGKAVDLSSTVTTFLKPLTITLPLYTGAVSPAAYYWTGTEWSQSGLVQGAATNSSITFTSTHLTAFVPFDAAKAAQFIFGPSPYDSDKDGTAYFWYWLTAQKNTSLYVFDIAGNIVLKRDFSSGVNGARGGMNTVSWEGKNNFGETLQNGVYPFKVTQDSRSVGSGRIIILKK